MTATTGWLSRFVTGRCIRIAATFVLVRTAAARLRRRFCCLCVATGTRNVSARAVRQYHRAGQHCGQTTLCCHTDGSEANQQFLKYCLSRTHEVPSSPHKTMKSQLAKYFASNPVRPDENPVVFHKPANPNIFVRSVTIRPANTRSCNCLNPYSLPRDTGECVQWQSCCVVHCVRAL
jgi:hypothetical protein